MSNPLLKPTPEELLLEVNHLLSQAGYAKRLHLNTEVTDCGKLYSLSLTDNGEMTPLIQRRSEQEVFPRLVNCWGWMTAPGSWTRVNPFKTPTTH